MFDEAASGPSPSSASLETSEGTGLGSRDLLAADFTAAIAGLGLLEEELDGVGLGMDVGVGGGEECVRGVPNCWGGCLSTARDGVASGLGAGLGTFLFSTLSPAAWVGTWVSFVLGAIFGLPVVGAIFGLLVFGAILGLLVFGAIFWATISFFTLLPSKTIYPCTPQLIYCHI